MSKELDGQMKKLMKQSQRSIDESNKKRKLEEDLEKRKEFEEFSADCNDKDGLKCLRSGVGCRYDLCPTIELRHSPSFKRLTSYAILGALFEQSLHRD